MLVTVLIKLCLPLPVHLVLGVLRMLRADVLKERCLCMLGCPFPIRGIHPHPLHSDNHQEWERATGRCTVHLSELRFITLL